jgi:hypothetical protein
VISAISLLREPQWGHARTSIRKTRSKSSAQVSLRRRSSRFSSGGGDPARWRRSGPVRVEGRGTTASR